MLTDDEVAATYAKARQDAQRVAFQRLIAGEAFITMDEAGNVELIEEQFEV